MIRRPVPVLLTAVATLVLVAAPGGAQTAAGGGANDLYVERDVVYRTVDGHDLALDVYRPDDTEIYPAVLQIHGGGWVGGNKEQEEAGARDLASNGFVVFVVEYRLAPADPYPAALEDLQAALAWVRANAPVYGADPDAVGAFGSSAGGHLAALLATVDGPQVDAAASFAGPMDLTDGTVSTETAAFFVSFLGCFTGSGSCTPIDAAEASPINHVNGNDAPLFIASIENDPLVPIAQARRMAAALAAVGVDHELVIPPTGGHGPFAPDVIDGGVAFLREHLDRDPATVTPPAPAGEPAPAESSDDRGLEVALLIAGAALVVVGGGLVLVARGRRPRPRPRSPLPAPAASESPDSVTGVSGATDDTTSVGRRA